MQNADLLTLHFHPLVVVDRGSETQLQVGENIKQADTSFGLFRAVGL